MREAAITVFPYRSGESASGALSTALGHGRPAVVTEVLGETVREYERRARRPAGGSRERSRRRSRGCSAIRRRWNEAYRGTKRAREALSWAPWRRLTNGSIPSSSLGSRRNDRDRNPAAARRSRLRGRAGRRLPRLLERRQGALVAAGPRPRGRHRRRLRARAGRRRRLQGRRRSSTSASRSRRTAARPSRAWRRTRARSTRSSTRTSALEKASEVSGMRLSRLRGNVTSNQAGVPAGRRLAAGQTPLMRITVTGSRAAPTARAADSLAQTVVEDVSPYVQDKIAAIQKRITSDEQELDVDQPAPRAGADRAQHAARRPEPEHVRAPDRHHQPQLDDRLRRAAARDRPDRPPRGPAGAVARAERRAADDRPARRRAQDDGAQRRPLGRRRRLRSA